MGAETIIAAASLGATAYGAVESRNQQKAAQREQRRAAELEQRRAAIQNARERRRAAAQANIQRAQIEAGAAAMGGSSTGSSQATGAITSQTAGNISFQRTLAGINQQQIQAQQNASDAMGRAAQAQAIGQLPSQLGVGFGQMLPGAIAETRQFFNNRSGQQSFLQRNPGAGGLDAGIGGVYS